MTPVGSGAPRPSLGFILPATTQGELSAGAGSTQSTTGSAADVAELCRRAEATGADSLWAVDHLYWPHPIAEAFTTLAIAAATTSRPQLGTCVLQLPLRPSSVVAKQATALQLLSGGRFVLGMGVGIHESEYVRAGVDYHRRGQLMDEGVAGLRRAWAGPEADGADYVQEPASAPVPLWFGGASAAARRRAAAVGDGWVPLFLAPDEYGTALAALRRETAEAGRDPEAVQAGVVVFACVGDDDQAPVRGAQWLSELYRLPPKAFQRHLVAGAPETCAAALGRYAEAGARHILVMVAGSPAVEHFGQLRAAFVGEQLPALAGVSA
ncbi:MAG TPA: LLM class flavin-dependent oxidoreductase [Acidimicrobiales bacterium]|nr:LLM class flavin-dependent oxidoreductase [Acidimicrobiales bacterium]